MSRLERCNHTLPDGRKCRCAALRGKPFCNHHAKSHFQKPVRRTFEIQTEPITDHTGLEIAVAKALTALTSPFTDTRRAGLLLYGLNIAASLIRRAPTTLSGKALRQSPTPKRCLLALNPDH